MSRDSRTNLAHSARPAQHADAPKGQQNDPLKVAVIGVSYKSAPVAVRERVAIAGDEREQFLAQLRGDHAVREAILVSTCNRVEIYAAGDSEEAVIERAKQLFSQRVPADDIRPFLYDRRGRDAVHHVFRVASSLDSLVVGEPQILGQVKEAFEIATSCDAVGGVLTRAMTKAFHVAKRVRSETALGAGQVSVASVAVDLAKTIYADLGGREVLLLGAGEIAESAARALKAGGATRIVIANRSFDKAEALASQIEGAAARPLTDLPHLLEAADIVLVSTGAANFVVTRELAAQAVKKRRGRALFFVDVAVPRNVDPRVHDLDNCYRYDVDDLEQIVAQGLEERRAEADAAERLVRAELDAYVAWARQLEVTPTVVAIRERVRATLAAELERTLAGRLKHLPEDDRKALGVMLEAAANKILHAPTRALKQAMEDPDGAGLVDSARRLFDLPVTSPAQEPVDEARSPRH
ncbi:MAG: glutamyl-tRNA reductase [Deltaproteobacteria bacterium]|nr:glutamyl-tRNA reductase [Deltaproteobacteria bacterium]